MVLASSRKNPRPGLFPHAPWNYVGIGIWDDMRRYHNRVFKQWLLFDPEIQTLNQVLGSFFLVPSFEQAKMLRGES
jgi:hypothetical protein